MQQVGAHPLSTAGGPKVDTSADRLKRTGWSAGDVAVHGPAGVVWVGTASRGSQPIEGGERLRSFSHQAGNSTVSGRRQTIP
jgi:hypothetical protein